MRRASLSTTGQWEEETVIKYGLTESTLFFFFFTSGSERRTYSGLARTGAEIIFVVKVMAGNLL